MSAKKLGSLDSLQQQITVDSRQARLELSAESISVHKGGIEFRSPTPFNEWAEMTIAISSPHDGGNLQCCGVVVGCSGNKHTGYRVSLVFTNVSKQAQTRLNTMASSQLGL